MELEHLKWRYAVKRYDTNSQLTDDQKTHIKESIRLTPSSLGLQPFKVFEITSKNVKESLKEVCFKQPQIVEADMVLVFASYTEITNEHIEGHIQNTAIIRNQELSQLEAFKNGITGFVSKLSQEELKFWTSKQTYIALGMALAECARIGIDSTPMEGFNAEEVNEILGLNEQNLECSVILTVGKRNEEEDFLAKLPKVRKSMDALFEEI